MFRRLWMHKSLGIVAKEHRRLHFLLHHGFGIDVMLVHFPQQIGAPYLLERSVWCWQQLWCEAGSLDKIRKKAVLPQDTFPILTELQISFECKCSVIASKLFQCTQWTLSKKELCNCYALLIHSTEMSDMFFLVLKKYLGATLFCLMAIGIVDVQECSLLLSLKRATWGFSLSWL